MENPTQGTHLLRWYTTRSLRERFWLLMLPFLLSMLVIMALVGQQLLDLSREHLTQRLDEESRDLARLVREPFLAVPDDLIFLKNETAIAEYVTVYSQATIADQDESARQLRLNQVRERLTADMKTFMWGRQLYEQVRLVGLDGVGVAGAARLGPDIKPVTTPEDIHRTQLFISGETLESSNEVWVSAVRIQPGFTGTLHPIIQIITPLAESSKSVEFVGYLVVDLNLDIALRFINDQDISDGFAYLVDAEGYFLAHSLPAERNKLFISGRDRSEQLGKDLADLILTGRSISGFDLTTNDDDYLATSQVVRPLQGVAGPGPLPIWTLVVAAPTSDIASPVIVTGFIVAAGFALVLLVTATLLELQSRAVLKRLDIFKSGIRRIYHGDLTTDLPEDEHAEFGVVAGEFNQMARQLRSLIGDLESRVQARIRDLELVGEISGEVAGLRDIELVMNRTINRIVERFGFYHTQVFLCDELNEFAMLVASTGEAGRRLLEKKHKLAIGSDSVIGRVTALSITVIAGDTASSDVPWQPNTELPDTRSEMALPLKVEGKVIGALDIQSRDPEAFTADHIKIFQVLADQLAVAIQNTRLINLLQGRVQEVGTLNQRLTEKVWLDFADKVPDEPLAYRYNLLNVEPLDTIDAHQDNGQSLPAEIGLPAYKAPIEIAGNQVGQIETLLPTPLTGEEEALIEAVAARVALAIDNARLVQETQLALAESQRLYEMARTVNSAAELDIMGVYGLITDQLIFERTLDRVAILLAEPVPSYFATYLTVSHIWSRDAGAHSWKPGQRLDLLQRGLATRFSNAPRESIIAHEHLATVEPSTQGLYEIMQALNVETLFLVPLVTGSRWFGLLVCGSVHPHAFGESFVNFTHAVADQLTIAIDNHRLLGEVADEARRALALAEAGQLVSQIGGDLETGTNRLFRSVSGPGEFDRWWFGLLEPNGYELRRVAASVTTADSPALIDLRTERNVLTEAILLRQVILVNDLTQEHPVLGEISPEARQRYGKHLAVPIMFSGDQLLGALLIGRHENLRDFDERDIQLATTLASQVAIATENQHLFDAIEGQRQTLQSTLEAMPAGVVVLTPNGDTILSNRQAANILGPGVQGSLFAAETYHLYKAGTDEPYGKDEFQADLSTRKQWKLENLYILQPDNHRVDVLMNAAAIYDEGKRVRSVVLILQEITELRELEMALQTSLSETTALYEASRALATASTMNDLVATLVEQLQTLTPDRVLVLLQERRGQDNSFVRVASIWPAPGLPVETLEQLSIPVAALTVAEPLIIEDNRASLPGVAQNLLKQVAASGIQSLATFPLRVTGDRILGWFSILYTDRKHGFSAEEKRLLTTLADQASVAINAQRLYESTQDALRSVANLYRGSKRIAEAQNINEAVEVIRDELMKFQADRLDLVLQMSPEKPDHFTEALAWAEERSLGDIPCLPIHPETLSPLENFDLLSRQEYLIENMGEVQDNELYHALRQLDTPYQAVLSVPLRVPGRVVGRLAMGFLKSRRFSADDRQFVIMLADATAYIVENEMLFQQTQDSLEETGVLYQASRAIASAQSREEVVQAMIDYAASATVDKVMLVTLLATNWQNEDATIEVSATWGRGEFLDLKGLRFSRDQLPIWEYLAASQIVWSDDVAGDTTLNEYVRLGFQTLDIASFTVVPLLTPNRPIGAIVLASSQPRIHQDREIRIYQSLADQAAIQLENKHLFEQTELRARQLATSAEVSRAAISILNLDELFPRAVNLIREAFNYDHAQIFMIDEVGESAILRAATGEAGRQMLEIRHHIPVGSLSVVGQAMVRGEPFLVNDTAAPNVMHRPNPYLPQTRSELAVPLIVKGTIVGVLDVQSNRPGAFGPDDIQVLATLADQLAIAIDNAELYNISQKRAAEMTFLFDVTSRAAASGNLLEMLENVGSTLIRQMQAKETAIFLHNRAEDVLRAHVVVLAEKTDQGIEYRFVEPDVKIPMGKGLIGWVGEQRQPLIVPDLYKDVRFVPSISTTRSGIYVPLLFGEVLIGVLGIEGEYADQYGEDDLRLLQTLSTSLASVFQSAQLVSELQATNERLREIDQLKTNFLAAMSHELRTPLNSIIGFSRVILKGIDGPINDMQQQDIQTIHDSGKHLLGLVNDILDQAKIEAGRMELVKEYFDLEAVVKGVMSTAKGLTKDKPIQLFTHIDQGLPQAFGDEFRTRQILVNLVSNAAKFTHEGSITVNVYPLAERENGRAVAIVSVADTGIGISQEDIPRIFEAFQQVDNTTTRSVEGTGLGLPLARSLAELQGGRIWVESQIGVGSTFYVTIPLEPEPEQPEKPEMPAQQAASDGQKSSLRDSDEPTQPVRPSRKVILAVDDEVSVIDLYRRYLSREGWQVIGETNPYMVEECIATHQPELILLDINMPERTGWEVLEKIKAWDQSSQIPVIVCSIDNDTGRSSTLGAARHLVKPFVEADLINAVHEIVTV